MIDVEFTVPIPLPATDLLPPPSRFAHASRIHGPDHVARVMVHAFLLVELTDARDLATPLWAAVYLHDLARTHDGVCRRHGRDAARLLETDAGLVAHLSRGGVRETDHEAIIAAVTLHSIPKERAEDHPHRRLIDLLKDADGLDRVRLFDLDTRYLRHDRARELVSFAQRLYDQVWPEDADSFLEAARRLWNLFRANRC